MKTEGKFSENKKLHFGGNQKTNKELLDSVYNGSRLELKELTVKKYLGVTLMANSQNE